MGLLAGRSPGEEQITRSLASPQHARVADMLRERRKVAGLTQAAVAQKMDRPQSFVADVEAGQRRLDVIEFLNFARAIGFDAEEFLALLQTG